MRKNECQWRSTVAWEAGSCFSPGTQCCVGCRRQGSGTAGKVLSCAGYSMFQLAPVDLVQPLRHNGGTKHMGQREEGKKWEIAEGTQAGEEGRKEVLPVAGAGIPCSLRKRPCGSRCSCCGLWGAHAGDFPEGLQPVGGAPAGAEENGRGKGLWRGTVMYWLSAPTPLLGVGWAVWSEAERGKGGKERIDLMFVFVSHDTDVF